MDKNKEQELNNLINTLTVNNTSNNQTEKNNDLINILTSDTKMTETVVNDNNIQRESNNEDNKVNTTISNNSVPTINNANIPQNNIINQDNITNNNVNNNVNTNIDNINNQNTSNNNQPQSIGQMVRPDPTNPMNGPTKSNLEKDFGDLLLRAYIGKNYDKIVNRKINFAAIFFGPLYLFYRKAFLYAILIIIITICSYAILLDYQLYVGIASLIMNLIVGLLFNKMYLTKANGEIYQIKLNNLHASLEELQEKAANEGGTSSINIFAGLATTSILTIGISIVLNMFGTSLYDNIFNNHNYDGLLIYNSEEKIEDNFDVVVPATFKKDETMGLFEYSYSSKKEECSLSFNALENFSNDKRLITQMQEYNKVNNTSNINEKTINGVTWYGFTIDNPLGKHYYYATKLNGKVYLYEFDINDNISDKCESYATGILYSIKQIEKED